MKKKDYVVLKSWSIQNLETWTIMEKYFDLGTSMRAMAQHDTEEQQALLCQVIDSIGKPVYLERGGEYVSVEKAKDYIRNYGKS